MIDEAILESLVQDLAAAGELGASQGIRLSPEQTLLSIPPSLVYLAGLVLLANNETNSDEEFETARRHRPPLPDSVHVRFQHYCQLYNQFISTPDYVLPDVRFLSPRIMPTLEQYPVIQKDIASKTTSFELLLLTDDPKQNGMERLFHSKHKKKCRRKSTKNRSKRSYIDQKSYTASNNSSEEDATTPPPPAIESWNDVTPGNYYLSHTNSSSSGSSSLKEDNLQARTSSTSNTSAEWISVPKITRKITRTKPDPKGTTSTSTSTTIRRPKPAGGGQVEEFPPLTEGSTPNAACGEKLVTSKGSMYLAAAASLGCPTTTATTTTGSTQTPASSVSSTIQELPATVTENVHLSTEDHNDIKNTSSYKGRMEVPVTVSTERPDNSFSGLPTTVTTTSTSTCTSTPSPVNKNHCRIRALEHALAESNRLLEEERRNHTQMQKEEQERHANSMQALQLRLYISETRLKTYQEALEDHIQSVGENVYNPNILSSPVRRTCQEQSSQASATTRILLPQTPSSPLIYRVFPPSNRSNGSKQE